MYGHEIVSKRKIIYFCCRIPQGMRGLKSVFGETEDGKIVSRIPQGMCGLKYHLITYLKHIPHSRIPQGMRGLK